jgi:hypothetical protein
VKISTEHRDALNEALDETAGYEGDVYVFDVKHIEILRSAVIAMLEDDEQIATVAPAVDAQPVAWRIFDGEGGYDYRDEPPPEVNVAWAAKHGRKYESLYTEPQSSQSAQSEPVAWANVKDDGTIVGLSQHPEDIANWQNPQPLCYQCKGCGDSEYGPWRCSRCEGSGFESAPNAAQSEGLRKDTWQPIEKAPKDGTEVLLIATRHSMLMPHPERIVGAYRNGWWSGPSTLSHVTHWMPLPEAPAALSQKDPQ